MWQYVSPILEQNGHNITAIELPGHGENNIPILQVTMASYIEAVLKVIRQHNHKVILVGHSMTGTFISQVAELIPEKIERIIHVAAFLRNEGVSVLESLKSDRDGKFFPEVIFSEDQSYAMVSEQTLRRVGFHDVEENIIQRVLPLMAAQQATEPFMAKVAVSDKNFSSLPKTSIRNGLDQVTSLALQDTMIANSDNETILDLESGHFPEFSTPEKLAGLILQSASAVEEKLVSRV